MPSAASRSAADSPAARETELRITPADLVCALVACVTTWLVFAPFVRLGVDTHHDGIMLKPAVDVWRQQIVFRDTFCQYGALTPYLQALAFTVLGPRLLAIRVITVVLYGLIAGVLTIVWGFFLPRVLVAAALAVWLLRAPFLVGPPLLPSASVPALFFQSVALLAVVVALDSERLVPAAMAGVAVGLTFLARQPDGGYTAVAVMAALVIATIAPGSRRRRRAQVGVALAGLAVVLAVFVAALAWSDALRPWVEETVLWPARWAVSGVGSVRSLLPFPEQAAWVLVVAGGGIAVIRLLGGRRDPLALVAIATMLGMVVTAAASPVFIFGVTSAIVLALLATLAATLARVVRARGRSRTDLALLGALLVAAAAWLQMYPRTDYYHPYWAVAAACGLTLHAAWRAADRRTGPVVALVAALFAPSLAYVITQTRRHLATPTVTLATPPVLAGMEVEAQQARDWERLGRAVAGYATACPRVSVVVEGEDALYATLGPGSRNPGPFFVVWPGLDEAGIEERVRLIRSARPLVFREGRARPAVQHALDQAGYMVIATVRAGDLLATAAGEWCR